MVMAVVECIENEFLNTVIGGCPGLFWCAAAKDDRLVRSTGCLMGCLSERTIAGLQRAKAQGRVGGRPRTEHDPRRW
jgi:hypothetical protein